MRGKIAATARHPLSSFFEPDTYQITLLPYLQPRSIYQLPLTQHGTLLNGSSGPTARRGLRWRVFHHRLAVSVAPSRFCNSRLALNPKVIEEWANKAKESISTTPQRLLASWRGSGPETEKIPYCNEVLSGPRHNGTSLTVASAPTPDPTGSLSDCPYRIHGILIKKGSNLFLGSPVAIEMNRIDASGYDGITPQCAPVCDPYSDNLLISMVGR